MLSAIVVGWTQPLWNYVRNICAGLNDVWIYKTIESPTSSYELGRAFAAYETEVVFLEIPSSDADDKPIEAAVQQVYAQPSAVAIVPVCKTNGEGVSARVAALGLPEPLVPPFSSEQLEAALMGSMRPSLMKRPGKLVAFVPSRPGSGATTVGLNTAYALARSHGQRVAFIELDEYAGILGSLLPEGGDRTVEPNPSLNAYSWKRYVHSVQGIDALPGATTAALTGSNRWAMKRLAEIARSEYDWVFVQIPRVNDSRTKVLAHQLEKLCLVSTADGTAMSMTRKRIRELEAIGLEPEKIEVVLNRCSESSFAEAFEKVLGRELMAFLPYDPRAVFGSRSKSYGMVEADSTFGQDIARIASRLSGQTEAEPKKRRFAFWSRVLAPQYKVAS